MVLGKLLIGAGIFLMVLGGIWIWARPLLAWIGHLPGDIRIERENFKFYFPWVTCLVLSVAVTLLIKLLSKFR